MTDQIVVGDRVLLGAGFRAARARLGMLAGDEVLLRASEAAYGTGVTHLVAAAGPAGAGLDEAILRRCATVAVRSFVAQVAGALAHPAGTAGPAIVP